MSDRVLEITEKSLADRSAKVRLLIERREELLKELDKLSSELKEEETAVRRLSQAIAILKGEEVVQVRKPTKNTIGNFLEEILRTESQPLHIDQILTKLSGKLDGLSKKTAVSVIRDDVRQRFIESPKFTFGLNPAPKLLLAKTKPSHGNRGLSEAVRHSLKELVGREFTILDVLQVIQKQSPIIGARLEAKNNASLYALLNKMAKVEKLIVIRKGAGSQPSIYKFPEG